MVIGMREETTKNLTKITNMNMKTHQYASKVLTASPSKTPKISIGLPVYNGEPYLRESIESILAQDFEDFELLISDNASTDGTWGICQEYATNDARVRLHRHERNLGARSNFSYVFKNTFGLYFMWHAHDDLRSSNTLSSCIAFLDNHPDFVLCSTQNTIIDHGGQSLYPCQGNWQWDDDDPVARLRTAIAVGNPYAHAIYGVFRRLCLQKLLPPPHTALMFDGVLMPVVALAGKCGHAKNAVRFFRPPHLRPNVVANSPRETVQFLRRQTFGDSAAFRILPVLSHRRAVTALISQMSDMAPSQKIEAIKIARRHPDLRISLVNELARLFREAVSYSTPLYQAGRRIRLHWLPKFRKFLGRPCF
jgi:glycosyltransferase involved in cell wall biosynthesis